MAPAVVLLSLSSLAGVVLLAVVANTTDPPVVPVPQLALHTGTTVRVEGRLIAVTTYEGGFARALLAQANRSVPILAREGFDASAGDHILVEVRVLQENGRLELDLERASDLIVVTAWRDGHVGLASILEDPWSYRGANVRTSGQLERDAKGTWVRAAREARVSASGVPTYVEAGAVVVLDGLFTYEPSEGAFRLRVERVDIAE